MNSFIKHTQKQISSITNKTIIADLQDQIKTYHKQIPPVQKIMDLVADISDSIDMDTSDTGAAIFKQTCARIETWYEDLEFKDQLRTLLDGGKNGHRPVSKRSSKKKK